VVFLCDAMLGGLARWLRAAGYDARFEHGIADGALVALAESTGSTLLSSDRPLFDRVKIRDGHVRALFVPRHRPILEQAAFVLRALELPVRDARCMGCGGELLEIDRDAVRALVPPKTQAACDEFWRCVRCAKVYWHGTHWSKIDARRAELEAAVGG
jgi:uncharacterized protein with PIN domain